MNIDCGSLDNLPADHNKITHENIDKDSIYSYRMRVKNAWGWSEYTNPNLVI